MAEVKRIPKPTEVGREEYKAQSTMTPEQQAEAAKKHKDAKARARAEASKKYQPPQGVEPERTAGGLTEAEMQTSPRKPGEKPGEGKIQKVTPKTAPKSKVGGLTEEEMNVKAPGYYRKGRYMTKPPPKPKSPPKKDLTATTIGGLKQKTPSQMGVDVKTGKPKKTYGERAMSYLEGLGSKVAPPGSVTRLRETGARAPRTMSERLGSISRTAQRTFPKEPGTRPEGIINIPEQAGKTRGPSLEAQKGTVKAAYRRKRYRARTAADVPGHGKGPVVPTGDKRTKVEVLKRPGELGEGHLGSYKVTGIPPKKKKVERPPVKKGYQPPERAETVGEIWRGFWGKKK